MFYCISDIRIFKSKTRFPIKSTQCCQGLDCSQCPYFSVRWSRRSASGGYLDRLSIYKGGGARLVAGFAELVEFLEYAASLRMIQFKAKKRLIRQDNGETALHRAAKGSHPSSLNSIVLSPVWIPSPSLRLHTGPGLQTKTLAHEDVPCAKSQMTWKIVDAYKNNSVEQRKSFLSEKALCYAYYSKNRLSKNCTKKRTCKKCKRPHPTLLHIEGFSLDKESGAVSRETTGNDKPLKVNNACVDIPQESNLENDILLQTILPVVLTERHQQGSEDVCVLW